ncbi:aldose 1-epimerase [Demequina salsinemoris]|uniref:aldose 1-epimerase n=1 Tax=Demequina salsinemoris TaxID=577470 RepID=UPI000784D26C|nr:aldose 1-epimerase [Demequina salsinemoris]
MTAMLILDNGTWRVGLLPDLGGSIAYGQVRLGETWVDAMRPTPDSPERAGDTASFPLVPWSNRISGPSLLWDGTEHPLRVTSAGETASHGVGRYVPWEVAEADASHVTLSLDSRTVPDANFPWPFTTRFTYALEGDRFRVTMSLTNVSDETFPAGLGHHPYFERRLGTSEAPRGGEVELQVRCDSAYELVNSLPTGPAGALPERADFRTRHALGDTVVDDCLTGRTDPVVATITWPRALQLDMEADESLSHLIFFAPKGKPFFAVEPVSHVNDSLRLFGEGVADADALGVRALAPGETFTTEWSLVATVL